MTRSLTLAVLRVRLRVWRGRACVAALEVVAASMLPELELEVDGIRNLLLPILDGDDVCRARRCVDDDDEVDAPPPPPSRSKGKGSSPAGGRRI